MIETHRNYHRISKAIEFLSANHLTQPGLSEIARHVGLSDFHLQRIFSEWVGISPKQFLGYLTKNYAQSRLDQFSVMQAALDSGLSGASRLHDLMISCEGVTPGEYKKQGKGLQITYGIHESPFSWCLIAITPRGICKLSFFDRKHDADNYINELINEWPNALIQHQQSDTEPLIDRIFGRHPRGNGQNKASLNLLLKGTPFQLKVWQALLAIPEGNLCSYQQVAGVMGNESSVRAVASAIAKNNIGYLIPCHRVIKSTGELNQYRWGKTRKTMMIGQEAAFSRKE